MIPLSRRHTLATALLLALAVLPLYLRQATGATTDPCADPSALWRLPAYGMEYWLLDNRQTNGDLFPMALGGSLALLGPDADELHFFVLRGDDPFEFYGFPDGWVARPLPSDRTSVKLVPVGSDVLPVHRRYDDSLGMTRFTQYLLVQGVRPISHPLSGGLEATWNQLVHGTQPVSMFVIQAIVGDAAAVPEVDAKAEAWLAEVWSDYREACRP